MTEQETAHFGADEELLSAYALGRLAEPERLAMERHAASCASCRDALRREVMIAAGTRKLGREELKASLRGKIGRDRERSRVPLAWSAAAALFVVAGLGVYYAIINGGGDVPAPAARNAPLADRADISAKTESSSPTVGENIQIDKGSASNALAGAEAGNKQKISPPLARAKAENERRREPARDIAASPAAVGAAAADGEFWSDGIVEPAPQAHDELRGAVMQSQKSLEVSGGADARSDAAQVKEEAKRQGPAFLKKDTFGSAQGGYLLRQQSTSTLPAEKDRPGKSQERIPTRIDQRGNTTTMTMYLDSLVDDRELRNAKVEAVSNDTVVVTIAGKRVLYHLQQGQGAARQRQK